MTRPPLSFSGILLEEKCNLCDGTGFHGKMFLGLMDAPCPKCSDGWMLTENGMQLCKLVKNHLRPTDSLSLVFKRSDLNH